MKPFRKIREFFAFSAGEKRGVLVLLLLLIVVYLVPFFWGHEKGSEWSGYSKRKFELDSMVAVLRDARQKSENTLGRIDQIEYFSFDPNRVDSSQLVQLGLSSYQIRNLIRYRDKGGKFRRPEDLKRLYGFGSVTYLRLAPYILVEPDVEKRRKMVPVARSVSYFLFDPNTLSESGWDSLGVKKSVVGTIKNYLKSGARFERGEDLKKIYGFSGKKYEELKSFISIPARVKAEGRRLISSVELNLADSGELVRLPGIGPVLSMRIVRYRQRLGGFVCVDQLHEVYGIRDSVFNRLKTLLTVDSALVNRINLNKVNLQQLKNHPYVSSKQAFDLIRYRERNGSFTRIETVLDSKLLPDSVFRKVKCYFVIR